MSHLRFGNVSASGRLVSRTPVASKIALPKAGAEPSGVSPAPDDGNVNRAARLLSPVRRENGARGTTNRPFRMRPFANSIASKRATRAKSSMSDSRTKWFAVAARPREGPCRRVREPDGIQYSGFEISIALMGRVASLGRSNVRRSGPGGGTLLNALFDRGVDVFFRRVHPITLSFRAISFASANEEDHRLL